MSIQTAHRDTQVRSALPAWLDGKGKDPTGAGFFGKVLCRLGLHTGVWAYFDEISCGQVRACRRCGKGDVRVRHVRQWQYTAKEACGQTIICARCGERGRRRTKHQWGPVHNHGDTASRTCGRCSTVKSWSTATNDD